MIQSFAFTEAFKLESGSVIQDLELVYHTFGEINDNQDNVVWVFHAISANSDPTEWWPGIVGGDCLYDPAKYFIICVNAIGSPYGSTKPKDLSFPNFTVRDVTASIIQLAEQLSITRIHTVIGGSFGGYQALEFAYSYAGAIDHLILLASSAQESAWGIAIHESQRIAMQTDASFGTPGGGETGMKAARSIAMLTYRTSQAFEDTQTDHPDKLDDFKASSYIQYQGDKFVKRFDALSYYYLTKCIDSHNIGRFRGGVELSLKSIIIPTLIIGFTSDKLVPLRAQELLAKNLPNSTLKSIDSEFGHDGFLIEVDKIKHEILSFYLQHNTQQAVPQRAVMKFGGSSLYPDESLDSVVQIILEASQRDSLTVVFSARGKATDQLIALHEQASSGLDFTLEWTNFIEYHKLSPKEDQLEDLLEELHSLLSATRILRSRSRETLDEILSYGELLSCRILAMRLKKRGLKVVEVDSRSILFTKRRNGVQEIDNLKSRVATQESFAVIEPDTVALVPGFISSDEDGRTTTLGRNGSNYTAALIADYTNALRVENWTDVPGIFTANPRQVLNARVLERMTFKEAHELANFGMHLLHPKTIEPLVRGNIPLIIKSTREPDSKGTIIDKIGGKKGIKAVSSIDNVALVQIEGHELANNVGIDGRIFSQLSSAGISVRMISQASSERSIGFVIDGDQVDKTARVLQAEFDLDIDRKIVSSIQINEEIGIIAILGRHNYALEKAIQVLRRHRIWMHLISNSMSGEHISLVVDKKYTRKALRLVHDQIFGVVKTLNVFVFGVGGVGRAFIEQINQTRAAISLERKLNVNILGYANSTHFKLCEEPSKEICEIALQDAQSYVDISEIITKINEKDLEHIVIADLSTSSTLCHSYPSFFKNNYDVVTANKVGNSGPLQSYREIRRSAIKNNRKFYYETNVGAGLPIIDTLKNLHLSSDRISRIRGVLSGSLSYIFNRFSIEDMPFSEIILEAQRRGLTETDPRLDLTGLDAARKLVIAAREVGLNVELDDVVVESLLPDSIPTSDSWSEFIDDPTALNSHYQIIKNQLKDGHVFRYIAEVQIHPVHMQVSLVQIPSDSALGMVSSADSYVEIYTSSYEDRPIIIQGAGAGNAVTARGVYTDILRIGREV